MPFDQARYEQLRMQLVDRNEANIHNIYLDVLGIPTVGLGVALTARQADRTMALDENHVTALANVLNFNPQQQRQLIGLLQQQLVVQNQHVDERHNNLRAFLQSDFGRDSQHILGPMVNTRHDSPSGSFWSWDVFTSAESPMQIQLARRQSLDLFNRIAPEYEGRLNNVLRRADCPPEALSEEQRAAIYSMVYQGATGKARRTADAIGDYWREEITEDELHTRFQATVNDPAFQERSRNELEFLCNIEQRPTRQAEVS
jgi:GH24 family phage-related lysozyme (muramidase)